MLSFSDTWWMEAISTQGPLWDDLVTPHLSSSSLPALLPLHYFEVEWTLVKNSSRVLISIT